MTDEYIVEENFLMITDLVVDKPYYWKVRPYNDYAFCTPFNDYESFLTADIVNVEETNEEAGLVVYPNILSEGDQLQIQFNAPRQSEVVIELTSIAGQNLFAERVSAATGQNQWQMQMPKRLTAGVYLLHFRNGTTQHIKKLIIR